MSDLKALNEAVIKGDIQTALMLTQNAMDAGKKAHEVLDQGLIAAMDQVGDKFAKGEMFVPQMLRSAKAMQECVKLIKPQFQEGDFKSKGKVVIGTVKGDLHDIGKNLVSMMMEGAGFTMMDLGVDVSADTFLQKVQEVEPDILAMSALLSTTMPGMRETIETLRASEIKADAYAPDAGSAVIEAKKVLGIS